MIFFVMHKQTKHYFKVSIKNGFTYHPWTWSYFIISITIYHPTLLLSNIKIPL